MKKEYFIISVIALAAVSLLLPFNVDEGKAQMFPQCNNMLDDDSDDGFDFIDLNPFAPPPKDAECTSVIDNDESALPLPAGTVYYISFQDSAGASVSATDCLHATAACASYNGDSTGCAAGWVCPPNDTTAACHVGPLGVGDTFITACMAMWKGTNCTTPYAACNCTCPGAVPPGPACNNNTKCDYSDGENMFNCPADCLPPGIPNKAIEDAIEDAILWILGAAIAISIVMFIYGGLYYVTSSGDTERAATSKKIIKYALLGVTIAGTSYVIIELVDYIIG